MTSSHELYQTSTMLALIEGLYDGNVPYGDVMQHGDFGVGTFNELDGEMVAFDGQFWHLRGDGSVHLVSPDTLTPFAAVTRFTPTTDHSESEPMDRRQWEAIVRGLVVSDNIFYAVRLDGHFAEVRTRTVTQQSKPYPRLVDATANDPILTITDTGGTIVGFHSPHYAQGIAVAGYHLHFLSDDRKSGGHVVDFTVHNARTRIDSECELHLSLQATDDFLSASFTGDVTAEIAKAEFSAPLPISRS